MLVVRKMSRVRNAEGLLEDFMTTVSVPAYHYALVKGYLLAQNPPSDVLASLEALHMAAVQGPLREDALEAIRLVSEAAEKLAARIETVPQPAPKARPEAVSSAEPGLTTRSLEKIDLPPITQMAIERASKREDQPTPPATNESDAEKIASFLRDKGATPCPPANASGGGRETVVAEPKKRKGWSPEAREAAAERMRNRQAAKNEARGGHDSKDSAIGEKKFWTAEADAGNGDAPEKSGADGFIFDPVTGYETNPKTGAIKLF